MKLIDFLKLLEKDIKISVRVLLKGEPFYRGVVGEMNIDFNNPLMHREVVNEGVRYSEMYGELQIIIWNE